MNHVAKVSASLFRLPSRSAGTTGKAGGRIKNERSQREIEKENLLIFFFFFLNPRFYFARPLF